MSIDEVVMASEVSIRMGLFAMLAIMAVWESLAPRRALNLSRILRRQVVKHGMHRVHHPVSDSDES